MVQTLDCELDNHLIGFSRYLRENGLNAGVQETLDTLKAVDTMAAPTEDNLKVVTRSLFCNSQADVQIFDPLFDSYWKGHAKRFRSQLKVSHKVERRDSVSSLIWMGGTGEGRETEQQSKEVSGANAQEKLRRTDFSKITEVEAEMLEALAQKLFREMNKRLSRRRKEDARKGQVNIRRTIRKNISSGGDPLKLWYKRRKPKKPRLLVFLDISGSMDKYSFYLLRFVYAVHENFRQVESFLFSTRLYRISDILKRRKFSQQLKDLTERAQGWSSGTTMGACFREFNQRFARHSLSRRSIVLILSDGLDTGNSEDLKEELAKISRKTNKLIWLNPLKGMKGYRPEAKGMKSALPLVDVFSSAHNLESLLELEKHLQHV